MHYSVNQSEVERFKMNYKISLVFMALVAVSCGVLSFQTKPSLFITIELTTF